MDAACAHLVLDLVLPGTRFALPLVVGSSSTHFDGPRPKRMPEATPHPRTRAGRPEQNLQFRTSSSTSNNHFKLVYRTVYSRLEVS